MVDFNIRVVVNTNQAGRNLDTMDRRLNVTERIANRLNQTLRQTFAAFAGAAALRSSTRLLAGFSQEMSTVRAVTGSTEAQFNALTEEALRLGSITRFTASQAAEGMTFLARAGFDANESLQGVEGTLLLAQAGALDLGSAADIASNVLTGFRLDINDLSRVVDVLALGANSANTNVQQLGTAMSLAAPVAAGLGVSVETATAAVGALSDAGLQGSMAGTGLRRVLSELESPSTTTTRIFNTLGIATEDVRISQVGLVAAMQRLRDAGVDTGLALEIFGDRGGPAFEVLSNAIPRVIALSENLDNAGGTAQRVAEIMGDNLNGAILSTISALQNFILRAGEAGGQDALRSLFESLTSLLRTLAANIDTVINVVGTLTTALGVTLVRRGLNRAIAGVNALSAAIARNPLGALATAAILVTSAIVNFAEEIPISASNLATLEDVGVVAFDRLSAAVGSLLDDFLNEFPAISSVIDDVFGDVEFSVLGALQLIASTIDTFVGVTQGTFDSLVSIFLGLPRAIGSGIITSINFIIRQVETAINDIILSINALAESASGVFGVDAFTISPVELTELTNRFAGAGTQLGNAIVDNYRQAIQASTGASDLLGDIVLEAEAQRQAELLAGTDAAPTAPVAAGAARTETPPSRVSVTDLEFQAQLQLLQREGELIRLNTREREVQTDVLEVEEALKRQLNISERVLVENQLRSNQALQDQRNILDELRGPQEELNRTQDALNQLLREGAITADEYGNRLRDAQLRALEGQTTFEAGFERAQLRLQQSVFDTASQVESVFTNAFESATDAIIDFTTTGQANFRQFASDILRQIARIALQRALLSALPGGFGVAAAAGGGSLPGFQNGGSFVVGGAGGADSQPVGFMATPGERVDISTPQQQRTEQNRNENREREQSQTAGGGVNLTNVNILDPNLFGNYLDTPAGGEQFINFISRNAGAINNELGNRG